jgi:cytochrome d ubiquinol oxidase subunit I
LRGRRDRYHRLGILIPFTIGAIATPLQFVVGDSIARWVYQNQPAKFAAMEVVTQSGSHRPEYLFGRYDPATNTVHGGLKIPGLYSFLAGGSTSTHVNGLAVVSANNRASNGRSR